jgi:hypothetical protein
VLSIHRLTTTAGVTAALLAALAIALVMSAAAANAKPVDDHIPARSQATWGSFESIDPNRSTAERSDVRSPDASDAAGSARRQDLRHLRAGGHPVNAPGATAVDSTTRRSLPGPPAWPVNPQAIAEASPVDAPDGEGLGRTAIVFGIVAALAIAAASAIRLRRLRIRRRRAAHAAT